MEAGCEKVATIQSCSSLPPTRSSPRRPRRTSGYQLWDGSTPVAPDDEDDDEEDDGDVDGVFEDDDTDEAPTRTFRRRRMKRRERRSGGSGGGGGGGDGGEGNNDAGSAAGDEAAAPSSHSTPPAASLRSMARKRLWLLARQCRHGELVARHLRRRRLHGPPRRRLRVRAARACRRLTTAAGPILTTCRCRPLSLPCPKIRST